MLFDEKCRQQQEVEGCSSQIRAEKTVSRGEVSAF
jgi:hypothetical protein